MATTFVEVCRITDNMALWKTGIIGPMSPASVEQVESRKFTDYDEVANAGGRYLLPAWLRGLSPNHPPHIFSASELDAIAVSAAFQTEDRR